MVILFLPVWKKNKKTKKLFLDHMRELQLNALNQILLLHLPGAKEVLSTDLFWLKWIISTSSLSYTCPSWAEQVSPQFLAFYFTMESPLVISVLVSPYWISVTFPSGFITMPSPKLKADLLGKKIWTNYAFLFLSSDLLLRGVSIWEGSWKNYNFDLKAIRLGNSTVVVPFHVLTFYQPLSLKKLLGPY